MFDVGLEVVEKRDFGVDRRGGFSKGGEERERLLLHDRMASSPPFFFRCCEEGEGKEGEAVMGGGGV